MVSWHPYFQWLKYYVHVFRVRGVKLQSAGYWITIDTDKKKFCPTWQDIWEYKTNEHVSQSKNGKYSETARRNCLWTFALSQVMLHLT